MTRQLYTPSKTPLIVVELERKQHESWPAFKIRLDHLAQEVRTGVAGLRGVSVTIRWKSVKPTRRTWQKAVKERRDAKAATADDEGE